MFSSQREGQVYNGSWIFSFAKRADVVMYIVTTLLTSLLVTYAQGNVKPTLVYSWVTLDYDWPNDTIKQQYMTEKKFIVENNIIAGIKLFEDDVFVTVPRWRPGVPSTLNRLIIKGNSTVLQPYPSWEMQTLGDCSALQYVQSMEVDPDTGLMWIIDNGRVNIMDFTAPPSNLCPPKLVIYNMNTKKTVRSYTFPNTVANHTSCFLNDIVLDKIHNYAFITDTRDAKIYVYDYGENRSHFFQHPSMNSEKPGGVPVDGIAMSADFNYVYYCPMDGTGIFQIPTSVLRDPDGEFSKHVRRVGTRHSRVDGLAYGNLSLFYGLLDEGSVMRWHVASDAEEAGYQNVNMTSQEVLVQDDVRMRWVDTFAWDQTGHLWFVANNLGSYFDGSMDFSGARGANMYVWKVLVNERSYLYTSGARTLRDSASSFALALFFFRRLLWI